MTVKFALLRSLLAVAEPRTADPELFAAVCRLARTDGATLAAEAMQASPRGRIRRRWRTRSSRRATAI